MPKTKSKLPVPRVPDPAVKLPPETYVVLRRVAAAEDRALRAVVSRAVREYAAKYVPAALQEAA